MDIIKTEMTKDELKSYFIDDKKSKIMIVGIGGSGVNMIKHIKNEEGLENIDLIVADTDLYALDRLPVAYNKMLLGTNTTRAIGSGMGSDRGLKSAIESFDEIKEILRGADIVFIVTGVGGCTGTGAAPIIARAAKELGALTISIVTHPFRFEGRKRTKLTKWGTREIIKVSDSTVVVQNETILERAKRNFDSKKSFKLVDDAILQAISTICKAIISEEETYISNDFISVKISMSYKGLALMGTGYYVGINAATNAAKEAIVSPLFSGFFVEDALAVLVHFDLHPDYPIMEVDEAMCIFDENVDEDATIHTHITRNNNMAVNEVKINIIATGFERV